MTAATHRDADQNGVSFWADKELECVPNIYGRGNLVLYFEVDNLDETFKRLSTFVKLIHTIRTETGVQRTFRFYDPDGHMIEIGEA